MCKKDIEEARMLKEMLETAQGLDAHGVMSKLDIKKVRALCEAPLPTARKGAGGYTDLD